MRVILISFLLGGVLGCGGVELSAEEEAAAVQSSNAETQQVDQAIIVPCKSGRDCIEYGQLYCSGDPGLCYRGACLCP